MIIAYTYFVGELFIPNLSGSGTVDEANQDDLDIFITKYENDYLLKVFGEDMSADVTAAAAAAAEEGYKGSNWDDLLKLLYNSNTLVSPLANFIYFYFMRNRITETTGAGEMSLNAENAIRKSNTWKLTRAWNEMVDLTDDIFDYLTENATDGTLSDVFANYDDSITNPFEKQNSFGI